MRIGDGFGTRCLLALADLLALDLLFVAAWSLFKAWPGFYIAEPGSARELFLCWNAAALLLALLVVPVELRSSSARSDQLIGNAVLSGFALVLFFVACVAVCKFAMPGRRRIVTLLLLSPAAILASHAACHAAAAWFRRRTGREKSVFFVGGSPALFALAKAMEEEGVVGRRVSFGEALERIGACRSGEVYCSLERDNLDSARRIFDFCENNLLRFYGVPEASEYFGRGMVTAYVGDTALLAPRDEPLRRMSNRIIKRSLDIAVSLVFLLTLFPPIALFAAWKIKRQSPGPVFFRQRRHGLNGREFMCIKFRSMHVNDRSDTAQTAVDDPRKFPFGDFMRRTNIDELPQFVNVLLGDMSVVGPRPHPVKMTDDFGAVVDRYRVRLYAKPGITGWAQVKGCRGAAMEVGQMVRRVRLDIWYLEHWTFWLDVRIIAQTLWQTLAHKNKNAF